MWRVLWSQLDCCSVVVVVCGNVIYKIAACQAHLGRVGWCMTNDKLDDWLARYDTNNNQNVCFAIVHQR